MSATGPRCPAGALRAGWDLRRGITMKQMSPRAFECRSLRAALAGLALLVAVPANAAQDGMAYRLALAETASADSALAEFYRDRDYAPLWTGDAGAERREALLTTLEGAGAHGLPTGRYDADALRAALRDVESDAARGRVEGQLSRALVAYARDISSGVVEPRSISSNIRRDVERPDPRDVLDAFEAGPPGAFLRDLTPSHPEYARLFRASHQLEAQIARGGWGTEVSASRLAPGDSGDAVIALRDRLIAMGYLDRSASARYDGALQSAVQSFQRRHALDPDGVAGSDTLAAINVAPEARLRAVRVAMERERWLSADRGARHIWVNLTDFSSRIVDHDEITLETSSIVGERASNRQTPEFSEDMTYLEINPDWTVPRSMMARDYLPGLRANPYAHPQFEIVDQNGRVINRGSVNFAQYSARTFPFNLRQPPGPNNALGRVKFMFPNPYAIYLHDTPNQGLFNTRVRAHSNGCVRLEDPFEFAYELLGAQESDPQEHFHSVLNSGQQTRVFLDDPVPVHLVYRTAFTDKRGALNFREDVYGRDAALHEALRDAGVESLDIRS